MAINWEEISFGIIAFAGEAKGHAMGAIQLAKQAKFDEANELITKARESHALAGHKHMDVVSAEAGGEVLQLPALFVHAEDQLLNTETIILMAVEMIELYKKIG